MGFYPHGKPGIYSYTKTFVMDFGGRTRHLAEVNTKYPGLEDSFGRSVMVKALWNLRAMIEDAKAAELAFLRDTGIEFDNPNAGDIFRSINEVLNSKQTFERGLKYMEELNQIGRVKDEKTHTYRDVSSFLETYLNQELKALDLRHFVHMNPKQIEKEINNLIGRALIKTYEQVQDFIDSEGNRRLRMGDSDSGKASADTSKGEEARQAVNDMIAEIEKLQGMGAFSQMGYLFGLDANNFNESVKELRGQKKRKVIKNKQYDDATVNSNIQGNALELITSTIAAQIGAIHVENQGLTIQGVHTGQKNQMKADTMLFVGKGPIDIQKYFGEYMDDVKAIRDSGENSKRMQNIKALKNFLDKLTGQVDHVIAISDKNVSIKANFDGFKAESERSNLQKMGQILSQFGIDQVTELITYLANCGASMVQGTDMMNEIKTELQTYIGYFLFDNLHVEISSSTPKVNVVNLLNVSGMYIPLSVYLQSIYESIQNITSNPSSLVNVTISLGGPTEQSVWTAETWKQFREDHETQSFISYKVLKDIADFITNL